MLTAVKWIVEIALDSVVPVFKLHVGDVRPCRVDARIIDENIGRAKRPLRLFEEARDIFFLAQVRLDYDCAATLSFDAALRLRRLVSSAPS